jgi:hypothetical protein
MRRLIAGLVLLGGLAHAFSPANFTFPVSPQPWCCAGCGKTFTLYRDGVPAVQYCGVIWQDRSGTTRGGAVVCDDTAALDRLDYFATLCAQSWTP